MTITRMTMTTAMMAGVAAGAQAGQLHQRLTVYVQEKANVANTVRIPAQAMASRMFAGIGISLDWSTAKPVRSAAEPLIIVDLVTGTPANRMPGALAYALPYEGVHISVFFDRIAPAPESDRARVLAHVMVHEITHLLQGISRHSDRGIMKARWTVDDICDMRRNPLGFTPEDVALIGLGLARRTPTAMLVAGR